MNKDTKQVAVVAGVAVGLAALTAAGYFVLGPDGKKNRKQIKGWTLKMKGDVLERLEKLREVTPEVYNSIIDDVGNKYGKLKSISGDEVVAIAADLKKHWNAISRDLKEAQNKGKKKVSSAKKTVAKKTPTPKAAVKKAVAKVKTATKTVTA
jgi:hypothetical protein